MRVFRHLKIYKGAYCLQGNVGSYASKEHRCTADHGPTYKVSPHQRYFQKYVGDAAKKEVKDIFGGCCLDAAPTSSGKRAPLGLDTE